MSDFQRRHYVKLAEFWSERFNYYEESCTADECQMMMEMYLAFVNYLESLDPRFDKLRFNKASGYVNV